MYENIDDPTLDKLLVRVREKGVFSGGRTTLFRLLKEMGFRCTLRDDKLYFYERRDIMEQRHNYLIQIRQSRREAHSVLGRNLGKLTHGSEETSAG